ncbi:putative Splicing factor [Daphnia magna]|uniref:Putative Splicing factor n=1 Tax=Daphnia magna TaxID=35525 RepID=A0A164S316_9CRUS|nr:putative Splicing factor [Daphnia magna]
MTGSTSSNSSNNDGYADKIVQVANVAPQANKEQMQTLFGIIGKIEDLRLYPTLRDLSAPVQLRICFVKYADPNDVPVALHLSNTVFIDRAVSVTLYHGNELPDEAKGVEVLNSSSGFGSSEPKLPATLTNQIEGNPPHQVIRTLDPRLSIHNLPNYPLLPASTDGRRLEEIRRTVVAINLDPSRSAKQVIDFFSSAGEVKYFRLCTKQGDDIQYAMIEFVEQESVVPALKLNNKQFGDNIIKVHHSTQSIIKPVQQTKSNEAAQKEIEEAVNRVKEAQQLIPVPLSQEDVTEKEKEKEKVIMEVEKEKPKIVEKEKEKVKEKEKEKKKRRVQSEVAHVAKAVLDQGTGHLPAHDVVARALNRGSVGRDLAHVHVGGHAHDQNQKNDERDHAAERRNDPEAAIVAAVAVLVHVQGRRRVHVRQGSVVNGHRRKGQKTRIETNPIRTKTRIGTETRRKHATRTRVGTKTRKIVKRRKRKETRRKKSENVKRREKGNRKVQLAKKIHPPTKKKSVNVTVLDDLLLHHLHHRKVRVDVAQNRVVEAARAK